jgi:putative two-component system response regulator
MTSTEHLVARVLAVDDEAANLAVLEALLTSSGYQGVRCLSDSRDAVRVAREWGADIVLLDLNMPYYDGYAVLEELRAGAQPGEYLPVLVLTSDTTAQAKQRALRLGATDFLTKPFDQVEVVLRIANLLQTRSLHLRLQRNNELLERRVIQRTAELEEARLEILHRLATAAEFRDDETHQHTLRVGDVAGLLGIALGLSNADAEVLRQAAPLHDLGKIGISDEILLKPGSLTTEEFTEIKRHTEIGARILAGSRYAILQMGEIIARTHHERWDGSGYIGLRGDAIPVASRIVAVADVFDALINVRPYKGAWPRHDAVRYMRDGSATQFDPMVVTVFLELEAAGRFELVEPLILTQGRGDVSEELRWPTTAFAT